MTTTTNNELYLKLKYGGILAAFEATAGQTDTIDYELASEIMNQWLREAREKHRQDYVQK